MDSTKFVHWEEDGAFLGYLVAYPDYWTQGTSLDDLKEHLLDLERDLTSGAIPTVSELDECPWRNPGNEPLKVWFSRLKNEDEKVRYRAGYMIGSLEPANKEFVPELIGFLRSEDATIRYWAARGLSSIGPEAHDAVTALTEASRDEDRDCRFWSVTALSSIGTEAKSAIPRLIELLQDPAFGIRQAAASALSDVGPTADGVVPALVETFRNDTNRFVREEIARVLGHIGTTEAVAALIGMLRDQEDGVRRYAVIALKMLGAKAKEAIPELSRIVGIETDKDIRSQAEVALKRMIPH